MRMKLLVETKIPGSHEVRLYQHGVNKFSVGYGQHVNMDLDRVQAAREYGNCIMHALSCAGLLYESPPPN